MGMFGRPKLNALLGQTNSFLPEDNPRPANIMDEAASRFPALQNTLSQYGYKENYQPGMGYLEHWSKGEPDSFDPTRDSLEIYNPKTSALDIAGDVVSHNAARGTDPVLSGYYNQFEKSLTPWQQQQMQNNYQFDRQHWDENRPFKKWYKMSGLPETFRGYPFKQWPEGVSPRNPTGHELYTPEQKAMFDNMMTYLKGGKP